MFKKVNTTGLLSCTVLLMLPVILYAQELPNIPLVDISNETNRHVVIEKGIEEIYKGHATTLLLPDHKTMFCMWLSGYGAPAGQMAVSNDDGKSWKEMEPLGFKCVMDFISVIQLKDNSYLGLYNSGPDGEDDDSLLIVLQTRTDDGGFTWSEPNVAVLVEGKDPCADIRNSRPGQYWIKLLLSYAQDDYSYPGMELLPDNTIVATTYIKYRPGEQKYSVVSTYFRLGETDRKIL